MNFLAAPTVSALLNALVGNSMHLHQMLLKCNNADIQHIRVQLERLHSGAEDATTTVRGGVQASLRTSGWPAFF